MTNIIDLSTAQLLAVYNHYADKPISRFADAKTGRARLTKLLDAVKAPEFQAIMAALAPEPAPVEAPDEAAKPAASGAKAPGGAKATILAMIAADGGTTERDVAKALGWPRAGGTISRAIAAAPFKVAKVKGDDGRTRYAKEG
jgi:hypothetical protein